MILGKIPSNLHHVVTFAVTLTYFKVNLFCPPAVLKLDQDDLHY